MWHWLNSNAGGVQAVAAVGTLLLTLVLAGVSYWYAQLTRSSLEVAKEQLKRQWRPQLGVSLEYIPQFLAHLVVHNISNCSVVITGILLKTTNDDRQASSIVVNLSVDAHSKETINIAKYLVDALRTQAGIEDGAGKVFLGVDYEALGYIGRHAYLQYEVRLAHGNVVEVIAVDVIPKLI